MSWRLSSFASRPNMYGMNVFLFFIFLLLLATNITYLSEIAFDLCGGKHRAVGSGGRRQSAFVRPVRCKSAVRTRVCVKGAMIARLHRECTRVRSQTKKKAWMRTPTGGLHIGAAETVQRCAGPHAESASTSSRLAVDVLCACVCLFYKCSRKFNTQAHTKICGAQRPREHLVNKIKTKR